MKKYGNYIIKNKVLNFYNAYYFDFRALFKKQ